MLDCIGQITSVIHLLDRATTLVMLRDREGSRCLRADTALWLEVPLEVRRPGSWVEYEEHYPGHLHGLRPWRVPPLDYVHIVQRHPHKYLPPGVEVADPPGVQLVDA